MRGNGYLFAGAMLLTAAMLGGCNGASQAGDTPPPPPDALAPMDEPPGLEDPTDMTPDAPPE